MYTFSILFHVFLFSLPIQNINCLLLLLHGFPSSRSRLLPTNYNSPTSILGASRFSKWRELFFLLLHSRDSYMKYALLLDRNADEMKKISCKRKIFAALTEGRNQETLSSFFAIIELISNLRGVGENCFVLALILVIRQSWVLSKDKRPSLQFQLRLALCIHWFIKGQKHPVEKNFKVN